MKLRTWSRHLVQKLWNITHHQWTYRNAQVHLRKLENRAVDEHMEVIEEVRKMMLVDPGELLPQHQALLEQFFLHLGRATMETRLHWLNEMESAIKSKRAIMGSTLDEHQDDDKERQIRLKEK